MSTAKPIPGIDVRHRKSCPGPRTDGRCCKPAYRAEVYDHRAAKKIRRTFPTLAAAKRWRQDAIVDARNGDLRASAPRLSARRPWNGSRLPSVAS